MPMKLSRKLGLIGVLWTNIHALMMGVPFGNGHGMPLTAIDWTTIWNKCVSDLDKARLIVLKAAHSSDWPFALLISSCGLRTCDDPIRVAVGFHLRLNLCNVHTCPCGATVSAMGAHSLSCKRSSERSTRYYQINDLIWWALKHSDVPATTEPTRLLRDNGKRLEVLC